MTRIEALEDIKEMWIKHIEEDHPEYDTTDRNIVDDLFDDIMRLITP
jgi:hypothetical protein